MEGFCCRTWCNISLPCLTCPGTHNNLQNKQLFGCFGRQRLLTLRNKHSKKAIRYDMFFDGDESPKYTFLALQSIMQLFFLCKCSCIDTCLGSLLKEAAIKCSGDRDRHALLFSNRKTVSEYINQIEIKETKCVHLQ